MGPEPDRLGAHRASTSALHTHKLLQLRHDLNQIALLLHNLLDVLVGPRNLIHDARVLAAFHAPRLLFQVLRRETTLRRAPAHTPTGSVRRRVEGLLVSEPLHYVRAGTHGARNDPEFPRPGANGSLASNKQVHSVIALAADVVVVAADLRLEGHTSLLELLADHVLEQRHHDGPVVLRVLLRPVELVLVR